MIDPLHGLLVLDKPGGITSRDAVNQAMQWLPPRTKIGHTGTLDPLATGVLVLCLGRATRLAEFVQEMDKTYHTCFVLGANSDTDDADGTIVPVSGTQAIDLSTITESLAEFIGAIIQTPPNYSAVKIGGRRAHALARQGQSVPIAPRPVSVYRIEVAGFVWPDLHLVIDCGKGTYIRSLARDLGARLGVGAYVSQLRRTRVGPFRVEEAMTLPATREQLKSRLRPPSDAVMRLPRVDLDDADIASFCHGQAVAGPPYIGSSEETRLAVFSGLGEFIGVASRQPDGQLQPAKIIRPRENDSGLHGASSTDCPSVR